MRAKCESPIEVMLYDAMIDIGLLPYCQYRIGKYRVDFCFPKQRLIIEADGKDFHKGWRKRKDMRRDEWLRKRAWKVLRFSGREIFHAAYSCAYVIKRELEYV